MKLLIKKGTTSRLVDVFIQDTSVTTGAGLSGLVYNTASLTAYYHRDNDATMTVISLQTGTVGTWATAMFKEIDAANGKGLYQLGIPNACLATGASQCTIYLKGATNMAPVPIEIQLTDFDLGDATGSGLTALASATNLATANANIVTISTYVDTEVAAIKTVTDALPNAGALTSLATAANLTAAKAVVDAIKVTTDLNLDAKISTIMTTAMTEGYAADGVAPTPAQMMFMLWSALMERNTSGVTVTTKKLDGSTSAMTFTLNDAANPSGITRAT